MTISIESILIFLGFVAGLVALRFLLWWGLHWLAIAWRHGPSLLKRAALTVRGDLAGVWFEKRFPRSTAFIHRRVDPGVFIGLPLTLIVLAALYVVFLLGGLVEEVVESEEIRIADNFVATLVKPWRTDALVAVFRWLTQLGSIPTLTAVAIVASAFLVAHGPRRYVLPLWLTVLGSQVTTYAGKFVLARPRPDFILDVTAATPSFPSGHTTGAMAVYGIIAYAVLRDVTSPRTRFDVAFATAVLIALVSMSRVFLGVHFASDVAAGLLVGSFWLLAGIAVAEIKRSPAEIAGSVAENADRQQDPGDRGD
jgi:membrane-associated phospholipid phosphatase